MEKLQNNMDEMEQEQDDLNMLEECSHVAQNHYGQNEQKNKGPKTQHINLQNASTQSKQDKNSVDANQQIYVQDFKKINSEQRDKSVHSEEDLHEQQDQEKTHKLKTEQYLFNTANQQKTIKKMQTDTN